MKLYIIRGPLRRSLEAFAHRNIDPPWDFVEGHEELRIHTPGHTNPHERRVWLVDRPELWYIYPAILLAKEKYWLLRVVNLVMARSALAKALALTPDMANTMVRQWAVELPREWEVEQLEGQAPRNLWSTA